MSYLDLKKSYPDHLLFYRLGSFYELYFDDAILVAQKLGIFLRHKNKEQIPSCGFPAQSLDIFSNKLLQMGYKIALAEQFVDPHNSQKIIRRVSKILTAGTVVDDCFLNEEDNILMAIVVCDKKVDLCFGNILLGNFYIDEIQKEQINNILETIKPAEILLDDKNLIDVAFHHQATVCQFDSRIKMTQQIFKTLSKHNNLALQKIFNYVAEIHNEEVLRNFNVQQFWRERFLKISSIVKQNLRLEEILKIIDKTNCQIGKRFLRAAVNRPLADKKQINDRLDGVEFLLRNGSVLKKLQNYLKNIADLERLMGRVAIAKNAKIDDLVLILNSLQIIIKISEILFWQDNSRKLPIILSRINKDLFIDSELINFLKLAIDNDYVENRDNFIKCGFSAKLDHWRGLQKDIINKIDDLEKKYRFANGIKNFKIEFNSLCGFYFEIKRDKINKINIPKDWQLLQNLNNSIRFSCPKLKNYQLENTDLQDKIRALQAEIIQELSNKVLQYFVEIKINCKAIGALDLLSSFAVLAKESHYVRPIINNGNKIEIIAGKHFISDQFIANDLILGDNKIWLITGANMAGKSTFLRQNALIVLLAQAGCFVPVKEAKIGVRKQIFVKMIVNDNLLKNQSSFMVEMLEVAEILNNATENSLVIIDELCQTTNNVEGGEIAFSIIKNLLKNNKSLALISSHNFDLAKKCQDLDKIICKKIDKEHKMVDGIAKQSSAWKIVKKELPMVLRNC